MCQVRTNPKYPILLIHWMIHRVQLLEIRKYICWVLFTEIYSTLRVIL